MTFMYAQWWFSKYVRFIWSSPDVAPLFYQTGFLYLQKHSAHFIKNIHSSTVKTIKYLWRYFLERWTLIRCQSCSNCHTLQRNILVIGNIWGSMLQHEADINKICIFIVIQWQNWHSPDVSYQRAIKTEGYTSIVKNRAQKGHHSYLVPFT